MFLPFFPLPLAFAVAIVSVVPKIKEYHLFNFLCTERVWLPSVQLTFRGCQGWGGGGCWLGGEGMRLEGHPHHRDRLRRWAGAPNPNSKNQLPGRKRPTSPPPTPTGFYYSGWHP